ncbi:2-hydroxyacyl-CoA dehydratase [Thermodesulfobacteriota bacterium]
MMETNQRTGIGYNSTLAIQMNNDNLKLVGFSCAYTPLPLIHAAGFIPYRILPMGDQPDQAGSIMHDNLCPHVKRILDRAMAKDLPELSGIVFMDSCESMRPNHIIG